MAHIKRLFKDECCVKVERWLAYLDPIVETLCDHTVNSISDAVSWIMLDFSYKEEKHIRQIITIHNHFICKQNDVYKIVDYITTSFVYN